MLCCSVKSKARADPGQEASLPLPAGCDDFACQLRCGNCVKLCQATAVQAIGLASHAAFRHVPNLKALAMAGTFNWDCVCLAMSGSVCGNTLPRLC